jgi:hypothetical protein
MAKNEFEQVQSAIDKLLNVTTVIKRKRKNEHEKKRELFAQIINSLEEIIIRSNIIYGDLAVDFSSYDEKFMSIIDSLIYMHFGQNSFELISWYIYERSNPDGSQNYLMDENKNEIPISNPYELYDLICRVNPNI